MLVKAADGYLIIRGTPAKTNTRNPLKMGPWKSAKGYSVDMKLRLGTF